MKKVMLVSLVIVLFGTMAIAFGPARGAVVNELKTGAGLETVQTGMQIQLAQLINTLGLTNDQLAKIYAEAKSTKTKLEDLVAAANTEQEKALELLIQRKPEELKSLKSRADIMKEGQTIITAYLDSIKTVLTYEQGEKLQSGLRDKIQDVRSNMKDNMQRIGQQMPGAANRQQNMPAMVEKMKNSPMYDRLPDAVKEKLESSMPNAQKQEKTDEDKTENEKPMLQPQSVVFNRFAVTFLSDWGIELLERFISGK